MPDLVREAKSHRPSNEGGKIRYPYGEDEIALAMAWARDEITLSQVSTVMGRVHGCVGFYPSGKSKRWGGVHCFIAMALRESIRRDLFTDSCY